MQFQPFRTYNSEPSLYPQQKKHDAAQNALASKSNSEPVLSARKLHPLLNYDDDYISSHYADLLLASETLENIVSEGSFIGYRNIYKSTTATSSREMTDRVLKLVYGTMKCTCSNSVLTYIDILLFLNHLGLVKVLIYDAMKHHFNYDVYPGVDYSVKDASDTQKDKFSLELVKDLDECLRSFQIKFAASYARLRIEMRAYGENPREQMENMLSEQERQKEDMAESRQDVIQLTSIDNAIYLDEDFSELLIVPADVFAQLKSGTYFKDALLIAQDKASMQQAKQYAQVITPGVHVIDARAGCGTRVLQLSEMVGPQGKVFAFENRPGRLETFKLNIKNFNCNSILSYTDVVIIEEDFSTTDVYSAQFAKVTAIVIEPPNSGSAIVDKLGFMLQEEEFPADRLTQKDLFSLKRQQLLLLKHAFKFPFVNAILYSTRSMHVEENDQVVQETLDRYGVEWTLQPIADTVQHLSSSESLDNVAHFAFSEYGNGLYFAVFRLKKTMAEVEAKRAEIAVLEEQELEKLNISELEKKIVVKKRRSKTKPTERFVPISAFKRIPRHVAQTIERLSVPKRFKGEVVVSDKKSVSFTELPNDDDEQESLKHRLRAAKSASMDLAGDNEEQVEFANLSIFGVNLRKFYGPRADALEIIHKEKMDLKWKYPVF